MSKYSDKDIEHFLTTCEGRIEYLSSWEMQFIESLRDQWNRRGRLSDLQIETLDRIYTEKTP